MLCSGTITPNMNVQNTAPTNLDQLTADQLRQWVSNLSDELTQRNQQLTERDQRIAQNEQQIDRLQINLKYVETVLSKTQFELAVLKRYRYSRASEQLTQEQKDLFDETLDGDSAAIEQEVFQTLATQEQTVVKRIQPKRQPLPAQLPRTVIHHEPNGTTCDCGCQLKRIGEDVAEKLDYMPGVFSVERHIRGKWVCDQCQTITQASVPAHIIDKGIPTTGLLAQVLVNKFADHLPLHRQQSIFARSGCDIAPSTLGAWVGQCAVALQPLVDALRQQALKQEVLHADETPVNMLGLSTKANKTKDKTATKAITKAYLWAYATTQHSDIKAVVYDFADSRSGKHAEQFLDHWQGALVCDDYSGYKTLIQSNQITEAGCMAHARRKFFELHIANQSMIAQQALDQFTALYAIEAQLKDKPHDERLHARQTQAKPLMDKLYHWLIEHKNKVPEGSATSKAINYSVKRFKALSQYINDADIPIDNNWVENQIRPIAVGRKNWLFAGSLRAGKRAAAIMSLIQTAKLNGLDPYAYLKDVLDRLPTQPYSKIDELMPHRWKPASN